MRRKIAISLDEYVLEALGKSSIRKQGSNLSRAIEFYITLGLSIDNRLQLAMPVVLDDLKVTTERLQQARAQQLSPPPKKQGQGRRKRLS